MSLRDGAVAQITLVDGNLASGAELITLFTMYGYAAHPEHPQRWTFISNKPEDAGAAIEVLDDGATFLVYSLSQENAENLNYLASRAGWISCDTLCATREVEDLMLSCFAQVQVESHQVEGAASSAQMAPASTRVDEAFPEAADDGAFASLQEGGGETSWSEASALPPADEGLVAADTLVEDLNADFQRIQALTLQLSAEEAARAAAEDEARDLRALVAQLRQQLGQASRPSAGTSAAASDESPLLSIVERHVLAQIDLSPLHELPIAQELRAHGYGLAVKLVAAA
jgi:hypothetical protein